MRESVSKNQKTEATVKVAATAAKTNSRSTTRTKDAPVSSGNADGSVSVPKHAKKAALTQTDAVSEIASPKSLKPAKNNRVVKAKPSTNSKPRSEKTAEKTEVTASEVVAPTLFPESPRRVSIANALRGFEQAMRAFNRRQYEEAKSLFENLQARFPHEVEIIGRAQTYIQVCNQKLSQQATPGNADELYDLGVFALNTGNFTKARSFFEKALRLKPDEPYLLYSLAATHAQIGAHDEAIHYLKRTIQLQPRYRAHALNDDDFSQLGENKRFLELMGMASPFDRLESRR